MHPSQKAYNQGQIQQCKYFKSNTMIDLVMGDLKLPTLARDKFSESKFVKLNILLTKKRSKVHDHPHPDNLVNYPIL